MPCPQIKNLEKYVGKKIRVEISMTCEGGEEKNASFSGTLIKDENFGYLLKSENEEILLTPEVIKKIEVR